MREEILKILEEIKPSVDFEESTALIDDGDLESLDVVALIGELNDTFDIDISVEDLVPENFNTVDAMEALVVRLQG